MGEAFGRAAQQLDKRVLFMASGGISHDPPIPRWEGAPGTLQERLIDYAPTSEERRARENAIVTSIQKIADGGGSSDPLNEEWDSLLLDTFRSNDLTSADTWDNALVPRRGRVRRARDAQLARRLRRAVDRGRVRVLRRQVLGGQGLGSRLRDPGGARSMSGLVHLLGGRCRSSAPAALRSRSAPGARACSRSSRWAARANPRPSCSRTAPAVTSRRGRRTSAPSPRPASG